MHERILVAGSGGQGIILSGKLLARVAIKNVPHITFIPAYGAEVRGGTSNCQVVLSSNEISSPVSEQFDSMLIMNQASLDKFLPQLVPGGQLIVNSSLCKPPHGMDAISIKATEIADDLGDTRVANFIMLGKYLAISKMASPGDFEKIVSALLAGKDKSLIELNMKAFRTGLEA